MNNTSRSLELILFSNHTKTLFGCSAMKTMTSEKVNKLAAWLNVLSNSTRLRILNKIIEGVQCNCELGDSLSMAPNRISHHISILCDSGIIKAEKDKNDARWIYYSVDEDVLNEIRTQFINFLDENRIQPCLSSCGPKLKAYKGFSKGSF